MFDNFKVRSDLLQREKGKKKKKNGDPLEEGKSSYSPPRKSYVNDR